VIVCRDSGRLETPAYVASFFEVVKAARLSASRPRSSSSSLQMDTARKTVPDSDANGQPHKIIAPSAVAWVKQSDAPARKKVPGKKESPGPQTTKLGNKSEGRKLGEKTGPSRRRRAGRCWTRDRGKMGRRRRGHKA
jgi:hypothetical protein